MVVRVFVIALVPALSWTENAFTIFCERNPPISSLIKVASLMKLQCVEDTSMFEDISLFHKSIPFIWFILFEYMLRVWVIIDGKKSLDFKWEAKGHCSTQNDKMKHIINFVWLFVWFPRHLIRFLPPLNFNTNDGIDMKWYDVICNRNTQTITHSSHK